MLNQKLSPDNRKHSAMNFRASLPFFFKVAHILTFIWIFCFIRYLVASATQRKSFSNLRMQTSHDKMRSQYLLFFCFSVKFADLLSFLFGVPQSAGYTALLKIYIYIHIYIWHNKLSFRFTLHVLWCRCTETPVFVRDRRPWNRFAASSWETTRKSHAGPGNCALVLRTVYLWSTCAGKQRDM
jgi:hypothetical protein